MNTVQIAISDVHKMIEIIEDLESTQSAREQDKELKQVLIDRLNGK